MIVESLWREKELHRVCLFSISVVFIHISTAKEAKQSKARVGYMILHSQQTVITNSKLVC